MAMNNHHEARRKAMFLERVCEAKRRLAVSKEEADQAGLPFDGSQKLETVVCTDQGQFYQTRSVHTWTGPERNRRSYDRSREGPVLGQTKRELAPEMNFREKSLSSGGYQSRLPGVGFQPVDAAFRF